MSTPNFYNKNASKIFASECQEEYDYDDLIDNVRCALKESKQISEGDNDRNYPATKFAEIDIESGKWLATIYLTSRSGYYSGLNLDWEIEILDQSEGDSYDYGDVKISNTLQNLIDDKIRKIEKVYAEFTTPLICRGVFSNGEAVYEKSSLITI